MGAYDSEPHAKAFDPPVSMRGSKGYRFSCGYDNPWSVEVNYGVGNVATDPSAGEMCMMLGFQRADYLLAGIALGPNTITSQSGGTYDYTSPCNALGFDFTARQGGL